MFFVANLHEVEFYCSFQTFPAVSIALCVESDDRLLGTHGLQLTIYENGSDRNPKKVFVNMRDIQRGADPAKDAPLIKARVRNVTLLVTRMFDVSDVTRHNRHCDQNFVARFFVRLLGDFNFLL